MPVANNLRFAAMGPHRRCTQFGGLVVTDGIVSATPATFIVGVVAGGIICAAAPTTIIVGVVVGSIISAATATLMHGAMIVSGGMNAVIVNQ